MEIQIDHLASHQNLLPTVAKWLNSEWGKIRGESIDERILAIKQSLNTDRLPMSLVAMIDGKAVGTVSLIPQDMEGESNLTPWVAALYVVPEFRNRGIGSKLISKVTNEAKNLNYRSIFLFATAGREKLYLKLGWSFVEKRDYRSEVVSIMTKFCNDSDLPKPPIREYLTHLHSYVYNLKKEAEDRAKSILTANAIFLASLAWTLRIIAEYHSSSEVALVYAASAFCISGFILAVISVYFSLKTFFPIVIDAGSPMEPIELLKLDLDTAINKHNSLSTNDINAALTRELRAVSELQIKRSKIVGTSGQFFIYSLFFLAGAFVSTILLFFIG